MITSIDTTTLLSTSREPFGAAMTSGDDRAAAEIGRAVEAYNRRSGRPFPTWPEILGVLRELGYTRRTPVRGYSPRPGVRVNVGGAKGELIRSILAARGGVPSTVPTWPLYEFEAEEDREDALAAVRSRFGWTCVDPA